MVQPTVMWSSARVCQVGYAPCVNWQIKYKPNTNKASPAGDKREHRASWRWRIAHWLRLLLQCTGRTGKTATNEHSRTLWLQLFAVTFSIYRLMPNLDISGTGSPRRDSATWSNVISKEVLPPQTSPAVEKGQFRALGYVHYTLHSDKQIVY